MSTDEFGGVAVGAHGVTRPTSDEFGGVAVGRVRQINPPVKLSPYEQADYESLAAGKGKARTGMEKDADLIAAVVAGRGRQLPAAVGGAVMKPFEAAGRMLNAAVQDVGASVAGEPGQGGNLYEFFKRTSPDEAEALLPYQETLHALAKSNPVVATAGKVAAGVVESAPMMAAGMPGGAAGKVIIGKFLYDMAQSGGEAGGTLAAEMQKPAKDRDMDVITDSVASLSQTTVLAPLMAVHAAKTPKGDAIRETAKWFKNNPWQGPLATSAVLERPAGYKPTAEGLAEINAALNANQISPKPETTLKPKPAAASPAANIIPDASQPGSGDNFQEQNPESRIQNPEVETATAAVAKVESHVDDVADGVKPAKADPALANTTGPRAAKEIKAELIARREKLRTSAPVKIDATPLGQPKSAGFVERVKEIYKKLIPAVNQIDGHKIEFVREEIKKLVSHSADARTLKIVPQLGELVKRAIPLYAEADHAGNKNTNWHTYGVRAVVDGEPVMVKLVVREDTKGKYTLDYFDDGQVSDQGYFIKDDGQSAARLTMTEQANHRLDKDKLYQWWHSVNPSTPNHIAGFGGPVRPRPVKVAAPAAVAATPAPKGHPVAEYFRQQSQSFKSVFAPAAMNGLARGVGNALRHFMGANALAEARASEAMKPFHKEFEGQKPEYNHQIIDALERDPAQLPARYQELAKIFRQEFDWRIKEIQRYAPNALQHLIENYFPHIWKDPKRAAGVMAQVSTRLFAGRKEFLKQRSLPFFADGIAAGLEPISHNPVDLLMAKMHSMDKFLLAARAMQEFKQTGAMRFKYIFEKLENGWQVFDDPAFIVQKPPVVEVAEAFDQFQRAKLGEILQAVGVSYERVANLGGDRWSEADMGMKAIRAKIGAHEPTLWHELGHQLDWKFPELRAALPVRGNSPIAVQLRALADLRAEGQEVSDSHQKYLRKTEEKMAELFRAYVHAPDLFRETAPDVLKVLDKFLDTQPELRSKLQELRRGRLAMGDETTQIKLGGMQVLGSWVMPDGAVHVVRNYLSPGLSQFMAYRTFKEASNLLNGAQLGVSGFHLGFTSMDVAISRMAVGIEDLADGNLVRAGKTFASVPVSPVTNILHGRRMIAEALHPGSTDAETAALVRALELAGGRIGQDRVWQTDFIRRMRQAFREGTATGYLKGTLLSPAAAVEATMKPIMEYVIPRQKLGVFADMARRELERLGPEASVADTREAMRKAWDSVDNRMGQFVYDNLFYNRMVKDVALVGFRAYGWQLGKYREGIGALTDAARAAGNVTRGERPEMTHRMAYALALPIMVGVIGGTMHYLMTGKRPKEGRDYFMPRTGELDAKGNPVRLNLPTYMKDVIAYSKHPLTSLRHSLNPMFSGISDLLDNKDFYGTLIRNPDDPTWKQGTEVAAFAAKQFVPFSVSGTLKLRENDAPIYKQLLPFIGITPVPARLTMTPAQELAGEIMRATLPPMSQSQSDHSQAISKIVNDLRTGKLNDAGELVARAKAAGVKDKAEETRIIQRVTWTPMQYQIHKMPLYQPGTGRDAMTVWQLMNDREKLETAKPIMEKIGRAYEGGKLDAPTTSRLVKLVLPYLQAAAAVKQNVEGGKKKSNLSALQE